MTDWRVAKEEYRWNVMERPNASAYAVYSTGGINAKARNNIAVFKFSGVFSYKAEVGADMQWKAVSERPGGVFNMEAKGAPTGTIHFAVTPKS